MVVFLGCKGDVEGASRAVSTAAADGDLDAFSAGLTIGAAVLSGSNGTEEGQMADILTSTFNTAESNQRTIAVASAVGGALASMSSGAFSAMSAETIQSINALVTDLGCAKASTIANEVYQSLRFSKPKLAAVFLTTAQSEATPCWLRRLQRVANSVAFGTPVPPSPCTRRMQQASAMSVSLVTASACNLTDSTSVYSAAFALVTAAVKDGCSFASAVTAAMMQGLPRASVTDVYTAAITKAGEDSKQIQLGNAFAAAAMELGTAAGSNTNLLESLRMAVSGTIKVSGCQSAVPFVKALYQKMATLDPKGSKSLQALFQQDATIAVCRFRWTKW